MARAVRRPKALKPGAELPPIVETWTGARVSPEQIAQFRATTGLDEKSILFPHVFVFRLLMATLTHGAFPLPIWSALQIRNRLKSYHVLQTGKTYDIETRVGDHRSVEKGLEVDLVTKIVQSDRLEWESIVTFFFRGRYGEALSVPPASPDLADAAVIARFRTPSAGGLPMGRLTGDYNGLHLFDAYARRAGFAAAFLHPQPAAGLCLARLQPPASATQQLDLWIKGPVFYNRDVALTALQSKDEVRFGLSLADDPRFAIAGIWKSL